MSSSQVQPGSAIVASLQAFAFFASALAEIPRMISYQGRVTDSGGTPVPDGTYTMRFRIYDAETGGTLEWDSGNRSIAVSDGVFNLLLGESRQPSLNLLFDDDNWLLVTFDGVNQTPRQRLTSAGYSYIVSGLVPGTKVEGYLLGAVLEATNTRTASGNSYGLRGNAHATTGIGVYGYASATTGYTYGVYGWSESTDGTGVRGEGDLRGGLFEDTSSDSYCYAGYSTYRTYGSGTNAFVQNHPRDNDQVIVYAAPEGDEVATYTRGTARLIDGEARVFLGETFEWVTNPDIGLTAHLTPRSDCGGLYVASLSTTEMIVREMAGGASDVTFDYIVYGSRIGFEEVSIVQEKQEESYIPSMEDHRELYAKHPDLRRYNALERFKGMRAARGETDPIDMSSSEMLLNSIEEYDPAVHGTAKAADVRAARARSKERLDRLEEIRRSRQE
jgi:hypothetical protein